MIEPPNVLSACVPVICLPVICLTVGMREICFSSDPVMLPQRNSGSYSFTPYLLRAVKISDVL